MRQVLPELHYDGHTLFASSRHIIPTTVKTEGSVLISFFVLSLTCSLHLVRGLQNGCLFVIFIFDLQNECMHVHMYDSCENIRVLVHECELNVTFLLGSHYHANLSFREYPP